MIRQSRRLRPWVVLSSVLLAVAMLAPLTAPLQVEAQGQTSPGAGPVVPLTERYAARSYAQWSGAWWQWALSIPVHSPPCASLSPCSNPIAHPLIEPTTGNCTTGNSGPVWFLGGVFFSPTVQPGPITRNCTVPLNAALFFPILNVMCSDLEVAGGQGNGCGTSSKPEDLRNFIYDNNAKYADLASLYADIDSVRVNASSYCVRSGPGCFSYTLPVDNLLRFFGEQVAANRASGCAVGDGYYLLLRPLSAGSHTLRIHGTLGAPFNYTLDVTHHHTVTSAGQ